MQALTPTSRPKAMALPREILNPQGRAEAEDQSTFRPTEYLTPLTFRAANATPTIVRTESRRYPTNTSYLQPGFTPTFSSRHRQVRATTLQSGDPPLAAKPRTHTYRFIVNSERFSTTGAACLRPLPRGHRAAMAEATTTCFPRVSFRTRHRLPAYLRHRLTPSTKRPFGPTTACIDGPTVRSAGLCGHTPFGCAFRHNYPFKCPMRHYQRHHTRQTPRGWANHATDHRLNE